MPVNEDQDRALAARLRRIEGQIQGLQRMLSAGRECEEVLTQVMAARSSLDQVGLILMERHIEHCLLQGEAANSPLANDVREAMKAWARFGLIPGAHSDLPDPAAADLEAR